MASPRRHLAGKNMEQTLYQILGVSATVNFAGLKRAYYARARECHPDLFGNSPAKTREFQMLVHAFDILSDPEKRKGYDASLMEEPLPLRKAGPLMDSEADDILEELIVGNNVPPETSLATLLADLEKTETFLRYREGRDHLMHRRYREAEACFRFIVARAPQNIIFRIHLARTLGATGRCFAALHHYQTARRIGRRRVPEQRLLRVKAEMEALRKKHHPLLHWTLSLFAEKKPVFVEDPADAMVRQLSRSMTTAMKSLPHDE